MKLRPLKRWLIVGGSIFIVVLTVGLALSTVVVLKAGSYAYSKLQELPVERWKTEVSEATRTLSANPCTHQLVRLTDLEVWLKAPLLDTLKALQSSCLPTPKGSGEPRSV